MWRVILIGNRRSAADWLEQSPACRLLRVYALSGSTLAREIAARPTASPALSSRVFTADERAEIIAELAREEFDILVSQGCPFVLPISRLRQAGRRFLNIHPSCLPRLRGKHPANGALLLEEEFAGATLHEMEDTVDTGRILHQVRFPLTAEIDLPVLYEMLWRAEAQVFAAGMERLLESGLRYSGEVPRGDGSYYSRRAADMRVDFAAMDDAEIVRRVRAFGIESQGVTALIEGQECKLLSAEVVRNTELLEWFKAAQPGSRLLGHAPASCLVKSRDGVIKINRWGVV